jgi:hypothetical protein
MPVVVASQRFTREPQLFGPDGLRLEELVKNAVDYAMQADARLQPASDEFQLNVTIAMLPRSEPLPYDLDELDDSSDD